MPAMSEATHATMATFRMDMSREDEQRRGLREFLVPRVNQHAGFLGGHLMLDREAQESVVVVIFSSRDAAEAFQKNVEGNAANQAAAAIKLVKIRVLEVTASA
jgi:heme-degrading monooxygenase HmoA